MSYTDGLKINVNKLSADEMLLVLLQIDHPFLVAPIRLVNDNKDFTSVGEVFLAMPFELKRQDDVKGELPKIRLIVPNVGRGMIKWIDGSGGGRDAIITAMLARRSSPSVIEEQLTLGIESVDITTERVIFNLVIQNNLIKRSVRYIYDTLRAPGLY